MTMWHGRARMDLAEPHPTARQLSDYLDDDLTGRRRRAVEAHLRTCEACSTVLAELRQVTELGFRLDEPSEPGRDLWPSIQSRLGQHTAGVSSGLSGMWRPQSTGHRRRAGLAVAATLVVACAATVAWLMMGPHGVDTSLERSTGPSAPISAQPSEHEYAENLAGLRRAVHGRLTADPRLLDVIEENLATIDVAITQLREALVRTPGDADLRSRIATAQQRKLTVLRQAAALATDGTN